MSLLREPRWGAIAFVLLAACEAPGTSQLFHQVEVAAGGPEDNAGAFIRALDDAEQSAYVALPRGADTEVADAIQRAWDRGVEVEVVTDYDVRNEPGILALRTNDVPVKLADREVGYFDFNVNLDVAWTSDMALMSHAFVITDRTHLLNSTLAGAPGEKGTRIRFEVTAEDLGDDLTVEHNQIFGGTDATELTAFSSPAKSVADFRWRYPTQDELMLEVWLGPQERLTKRIIDATYAAKSSVWILTNDFSNAGLAFALQHKAELGFDVQVVVGPGFASADQTLSGELADKTPDVAKKQIVDVDEVPTLVLIDYERAVDGQYHEAKAMVLSHDLYAAARIYEVFPGCVATAEENNLPSSGCFRTAISDQLIDGNLFVLVDRKDGPAGKMLDLKKVWTEHLDRAEKL